MDWCQLGGQIGRMLFGGADEVLYRHAVSAERMKKRYRFDAPRFTLQPEKAPRDHVVDQLRRRKANLIANDPVVSFREPSLPSVPAEKIQRPRHHRRSARRILRAESSVEIPKGKVRVLLRSRTTSRLWLDGKW